MGNTLFCERCAITKEYFKGTSSTKENTEFCAGYLVPFGDSIERCPYCGNTILKSIPISNKDFLCLRDVSNCNRQLLEAMIELKQKDPIEFELKMSQFRNQVEQQENIQKQQSEQLKVHCPYCNSVNVKKISGTERVTSVAVMGIFSKKINKSFKCNNCGGTF